MTKSLEPGARWELAMLHLIDAEQASVTMRTAPKPDDRDNATKSYIDAVDALVAELAILRDRGHLASVGAHIEKAHQIALYQAKAASVHPRSLSVVKGAEA